MSKLLRKK